MSIAQNPLFTSLRKSFANVTAYTLNGQNIIRAKAFNPKNPKTVAQTMQRTGFKLISQAYQSFGQYTELGFVERKGNFTAYNAFFAANLQNAIDKTGAEPVIDYSKLLISKGSLPPVSVSDCVLNDNVITLNYLTKNRLPKVSTTDEIVLLAILKSGAIYVARQVRGNEFSDSIELTDRNLNQIDLICCYIFALSADGKRASNSVYVEIG
ncbi:MAG: DUF6266 family protein [Paludibacter sp.]